MKILNATLKKHCRLFSRKDFLKNHYKYPLFMSFLKWIYIFLDIVEFLLMLWMENMSLVNQSWSLAAERTVFAVIPVKAVLPTLMTDGEFSGVLAVKRPLVVTPVRVFWKRNKKKTIPRNFCPYQDHLRCVSISGSFISYSIFHQFLWD